MPNWCYNNLYVSGPSLDKFIKDAKIEEKFENLLEVLFPTPTELLDIVAPTKIVETQAEADVINKEDCPPTSSANPIRAITKQKESYLIEQYGHANWYDWRLANWGTKWDITPVDSHLNGVELSLSFESAWSPPTSAIVAISKHYPDLEFELIYDEPGMAFSGEQTIRDGKIWADKYVEYAEEYNDETENWERFILYSAENKFYTFEERVSDVGLEEK